MPRYLPGAQTFDRLAVRAETERFVALADRLADLERPVAPRGVLLLEQLLDDAWGPLHDRDRADELRRRPRRSSQGARALMVELLGIVIALACFAFSFALIYFLSRV